MKMRTEKTLFIITGILLLIAIGALIFGWLEYNKLKDNLYSTEKELRENIANLEIEKREVEEALFSEQQKNMFFANQINEIAGTVGNLKKLSETDKELLQKYSKVYFLNEHYIPSDLSEVPSEYLYEGNREQKIHSRVLPYLEDLLTEAKKDGVDLLVISSYRSFGEQSLLKTNYKVTYGTGANQFSADQGYSEHQLGTTADFTTSQTGSNFLQFKNTDAYKWLKENAHRFGFILSYPDNNSYYEFEPWHWRFVGTGLANRLFEEGKYFYDLDQREIDRYLISVFN